MLLRNIYLKNLRDRRIALFWWSISIFLMVLSIVAIYPSIQDSAADLEGYIESLPDAFKAAFGLDSAAALTTPEGFLNGEFFSFVIPVFFLIFAIGFGSSAIAGEEESGTLDLLLANPIPRWRIVVEKFISIILGTGLLALVTWLSFAFSIAVFDIDIGIGQLAAATVNSALLGLCFGIIALAVSSATGRKGLSMAIAIGATTASYLLNILSKIAESLEPFEKLSLFFYHVDADPLSNGLILGDVAIYLAVIAAFLSFAIISFKRRDLAV